MSQYSLSRFLKDPNSSWNKTYKLIPENSKVLDVGCSSGNFGEILIKNKNCIVDGVEIDKKDILRAQKKLRKVYDLNVETEPINISEKYDIVFMGDIIEHLARPVPVLKNLKKTLNKNGKLIYSIPNICHMSVRLMMLAGNIEYGKSGLLDETHLHFYNSKEVRRIFSEAYYKIDIFDYTVNDLPYEIIKRQLNDLGLNITPKFKETIQSIDGAAYQFVGQASPSSTKPAKIKLPDVSPLNAVDQYIHELKDAYQKNLEAVIADRDRIKMENEELKKPKSFRDRFFS